MGRAYQIVSAKGGTKLADGLQREGRFLLPMLDLLERAEVAVDEVTAGAGRAGP